MMAKMFYTLEEAKGALGKSEDEIKQFAREGRLREFRDGPRLMFKADQVEQLKGELAGGGDNVDLGVSDSGGMIGLVDTAGPSGTSITLSDDLPGSGAGSSGAPIKAKDDTALAADLGLSGSMGGIPSPGRPSASGTGLSGSAMSRQGGISVFGSDEPERVDPSAQTAISGGIREQINLEGVGSGSGLLDLTRESDDTSLGAVLDEITPGGTVAGRRGSADVGDIGIDLDEAPRGVISRVAAEPMQIEAADPMAPAFGAAALAAGLVLLGAVFVLICAISGATPDVLKWFDEKVKGVFAPAGMGLAIVVLFFIVGLLVGKATTKRA